MCPWPRIQAALTDEYALNVTYRYDRGEPRASVKKSALLRQRGLPAGDCIDCRQCVHVCPTGVDIRDGASLGCIQCGLCIDACDTVMAKIGRPQRLIAYDTDVNLKRRQAGQPAYFKLVRARTVLYAAIIAVVGSVMLYALASRRAEAISVIHDRNPLFVILSDGAIRNGFTVRLLNKSLDTRRFALNVDGIADASTEIVGHTEGGADSIDVGPDQTRELRVLVTSHAVSPTRSIPLTFRITNMTDGTEARAVDHFHSK